MGSGREDVVKQNDDLGLRIGEFFVDGIVQRALIGAKALLL
jgi:hypothetical protein